MHVCFAFVLFFMGGICLLRMGVVVIGGVYLLRMGVVVGGVSLLWLGGIAGDTPCLLLLGEPPPAGLRHALYDPGYFTSDRRGHAY